MDIEKLDTMKFLLKGLRREDTENLPSASVAEAIDLLIECVEFIFDSYQPESSKREDDAPE